MTSAFKAKFPLGAVSNLKSLTDFSLDPAAWAKEQIAGVGVGDIIICFETLMGQDNAVRGIATSSLLLVFRNEKDTPLCLKLTDDEYSGDTLENTFKQLAEENIERKSSLYFATVPCRATIGGKELEQITNMHRWGRKGSRANAANSLPDPLVTFLASVGAEVSASNPVSIGSLSIALIAGATSPGLPDLSSIYSLIGNVKKKLEEASPASEPSDPLLSIASVAIMEQASEKAQGGSPADLLNNLKNQTQPKDQPAVVDKEDEHAPDRENDVLASTPQATELATKARVLKDKIESMKATRGKSNDAAEESQTGSEAPSGGESEKNPAAARETTRADRPRPGRQEKAQKEEDVQSPTESGQMKPPLEAGLSDDAPSEAIEENSSAAIRDTEPSGNQSASQAVSMGTTSGLPAENIRTKLSKWASHREPQRRFAGLLDDESENKPAFVVTMQNQLSKAVDRLEERVASNKTELLDRLMTVKHSLTEKEQRSMASLEGLRNKLSEKLRESAQEAKSGLSETAASGTELVQRFASRASVELNDIATLQNNEINSVLSDAKDIVDDTISGTQGAVKGKVQESEGQLDKLLKETESNLGEIADQCGARLDERIVDFRNQGDVTLEGMMLSMEAMVETAKNQAFEAEQDAVRRVRTLAKQTAQAIHEQLWRLDKECQDQVEKLTRDRLLPQLQYRRQNLLELTTTLREEFSTSLALLLDSKLAEFAPFTDACSRFSSGSVNDFKARWRNALDEHQKRLDEIVFEMETRVKGYLQDAHHLSESMKEITKITDYVMSNSDLINARDGICSKFESTGKQSATAIQARLGMRLQNEIAECRAEFSKIREESLAEVEQYGNKSVDRARNALQKAMKELEVLQARYTAGNI